MKCVLYRQEGAEIPLAQPLSLYLQQDVDLPAAGLTARFPAERPMPSGTFLRVTADGGCRFDGVVDKLRCTWGQSGILTVSARSRAALLLDSEAVPSLYRTPSLPLLFRRHAAPYGFSGLAGDKRVFSQPYSIAKGTSEWNVLDGFCRQYLGTSLREEHGTLTALPQKMAETARIGTGGIPYLQVSRAENICYEYSSYWGIDRNYFWQEQAQDDALINAGLLRQRLCADPQAAAQAAERKAHTVTVLCAGWPVFQIGQSVLLNLPDEQRYMMVTQTRYQLDRSGRTVRLQLCRQV